MPIRTGGLEGSRPEARDRSGRDLAERGEAGRDRLRSAAGDDHGGVRADQGDAEGDRRAEAGKRHLEGCGWFLRGRARPATHTLVAFIDEHRARFGGVEPICRTLTQYDSRSPLADPVLHDGAFEACINPALRDGRVVFRLVEEAYSHGAFGEAGAGDGHGRRGRSCRSGCLPFGPPSSSQRLSPAVHGRVGGFLHALGVDDGGGRVRPAAFKPVKPQLSRAGIPSSCQPAL